MPKHSVREALSNRQMIFDTPPANLLIRHHSTYPASHQTGTGVWYSVTISTSRNGGPFIQNPPPYGIYGPARTAVMPAGVRQQSCLLTD